MAMGWPETPHAAGDGTEGYTGSWGSGSSWSQPAQGLRWGCNPGKSPSLEPHNHEQWEQHVAGSDWFAPVASLQAPRDSCLGTAGFLKGHLQALILRWGRGKGEGGSGRGGCIDCLGLKAVNLFFPLSLLGHFYWRDEGRQSTAPQLALLLEVNDPVSSSWLHFPTFCRHQDPSPCQVHSVPWSSANASQITM